MSVLEKTINLLKTMPDDKVETVYAFVRFINSGIHEMPSGPVATKKEDARSALGILHEYADSELIEQEEGDFELREDPFYSAENQARLLAAKKRMEKQNK